MNDNEPQYEDINLDVNLEDVEVGRPVVAAGVYKGHVVGMVKKGTKAAPDNKNMIDVAVALDETVKTVGGKEINPGFQLHRNLFLEDVGKMSPGQFKEGLAELKLAATGSQSGPFRSEEIIGKPLKVRVTVRPEREDKATGQVYPQSNEIYFLKDENA